MAERKGTPVTEIWSLASHRPEDYTRYNQTFDPAFTNRRPVTFSDGVQMDIRHGADKTPAWRPGE